jgi:alcohol dehydrogenase, propanol-preferring
LRRGAHLAPPSYHPKLWTPPSSTRRWASLPAALQAVGPGGSVVCAGIHMSDIPAFPYRLLWRERCVRSVANLTRRDGEEFFGLVRQLRLETSIVEYELGDANRALADLRAGRHSGAAVLRPRD